MRLSVGIKLGVWLALLGTVSTGLTGYYVYERSRELLIKSSQEKLLTATQVLAQRFSGSLANISADVEFIASLPLLQQLTNTSADSPLLPVRKKQISAIFSGLMETRSAYSQIRLIGIDNYGKELIRVDRIGEKVDEIKIVTGSDLQEKGYLPYFFETLRLQPGQFYVSRISLNQEQGAHYGFGKPTIRIATPIRQQNGSAFGIVVINVDLNNLFNLISTEIPQDLKTLLANDAGDYLIHPDPAKTFGFNLGRRFLIQEDMPAVKPVLSGKAPYIMLESNNILLKTSSLVAFVQISFGEIAKHRFVLLGLYTPLENVLAKSKKLGISVIEITLIFIALATLVALLLARILAKPINLMAHAARLHAQGLKIPTLPMDRNDEIGDLAKDFSDMTKQLDVQMLEIQTAESRLQMQIDRMPIGLIVWDRDFRVRTWNPAATSIFGYTEDDALGKHAYDLIVPKEVTKTVDDVWSRLLMGDMTAYSVNENITKDGHMITCEWTNTPLIGSDGISTTVLSMVQDITSRKQAEHRLQLAASVFSYAREGIMITDANANIIEVNDTFTHITGYNREEAIGKNPRILNSGLQGPEFYTSMWQTILKHNHWQGEIWNRCKGGEVYAALLTISAVRNTEGNTKNYVALFTDITPMKKYQQQLEQIAHYDVLTSLPNRVLLTDRLKHAIAQSQRHNQSLAVAYLDLDGFKAVNDGHGHDTGDKLLVKIVQRMKAVLREGDTLARIGGDEFVAVLENLDQLHDCEPILVRLLQSASEPVTIGGAVLQVSTSIGVTLYPQDGATEADQLLRHADQAMYQAKRTGKNRYYQFNLLHDVK
jgi:diguanylate cyclase (GGDEF)-like protein/PAS domain S-box-containing protein